MGKVWLTQKCASPLRARPSKKWLMKPPEPNLAGADFVEVRFDRLYIKRPEAEAVEDENGEGST